MSVSRFVRRPRRELARPALVGLRTPRLYFEPLEDRLTPISTPNPLFLADSLPATGSSNQSGAPLSIIVADINGDGRADFAGVAATNVLVPTQPRIDVYLSDGPTGKGYTPVGINVGGANLFQSPLSIAAIDVTSDGKAEIGSYSSATGNIRVDRLENTGVFLGLFTTQIDFELANGIPDPAKPNKNLSGIVGGDFNGDGKGDFIVTLTGSTNNHEYFVLLNNGTGKNFTPLGTPLKTGLGVGDFQRPIAADFDQDGNLDFAMMRPANNQVVVMFGDGAGSFSFARSLGVGSTPTAIAAGDFDGNGKIDLAVGQKNGRITLFLKDPTSNTFTTKQNAAIVGNAIVGMSAGDFDLDNIADIAVVTSNGNFPPPTGNQNLDVYLGRTTVSTLGLTLAPGSSYGPLVGIGGSVATADLDGNGNPDLIVGEGLSFSQQFTPYYNRSFVGGETFIAQDTSLAEFGEPVTYTVTVIPPPRGGNLPTGTVQFFEVFTDTQGTQTFNFLGSNPLAPALDVDGSSVSVADFSFNAFPVGQHTVVGKYLGDGLYLPTQSTLVSVSVTKASTLTAVSTPVPAPVFGQPVPIFANVISKSGQIPTGAVVFFDNGSLIGNGMLDAGGQATITISNFTLGAHSIQAQFLGATNYNTSVSNGLNLPVASANSSVSIAIDKMSATFGDTVILSSMVAISSPGVGVPSGNVEYFEGTTKLGSAPVNSTTGLASFAVPGLAVGGHTFVAKYLGNSSVAGSTSGTVGVVIDPTQSQASLTAPVTIQLGQTADLTAFVSDTMLPPRPVNVGTVMFTGTDANGAAITIGPVAVVNGVATATVAGLPQGNANFTATFSGTASITSAVTNPVAVFTGRAVPNAVIANSAGADSSVLGKSITFTTTYTPSNGLSVPVAGTATFFDNGTPIATVPLVNGVASIDSRLALGDHTITVNYSGSPTYVDLQQSTKFTVARPIDPIAVGAGLGGTDIVRIYNPDGSVNKDPLFAFGPDHTSGARIATGDVNGDGVPDRIIGTGPGTQARIRVLDGATDLPLFEMFPFEQFTGGVYVAVGDITGDFRADIVVSPDEGGGPRVTVVNGSTFKVIADFFGIDDSKFRGGARVALGDINGDSVNDVVVAAGFGGGPRIAAFSGTSVRAGVPIKLFNDFFAFEQTLRNGVFVAGGDVDGDGFGDIVLGGGPGGGPRVIAVSGAELLSSGGAIVALRANFFAGDSNLRNGVPVAVRQLDGDNKADIVTGSGPGGRRVNAFLGANITPTNQPIASQSFDAFDANFNPLGGVFVG
jgi:Bacterial Ig-like domain (group 3)/FG-GAP-like repeat